MKLHLGSGRNLKDGYINIDAYVQGEGITNLDIFNLPYADCSVDEILAEHLVEHIKFKDEEVFWRECYRLLKHGGKLTCETPDMEWLCKNFIEGIDDFKEFYKVGSVDHYFGNKTSTNQRWGIITTHFFGNQNGEGQYHYNAYTDLKMKRIAQIVGFKNCVVTSKFNKGAQAIIGVFTK